MHRRIRIFRQILWSGTDFMDRFYGRILRMDLRTDLRTDFTRNLQTDFTTNLRINFRQIIYQILLTDLRTKFPPHFIAAFFSTFKAKNAIDPGAPNVGNGLACNSLVKSNRNL